MKSKRAALEMSTGMIVTIVLLMTVLILGLVFVRSVFNTGTSAVNQVDSAVQNEINKLFAEEEKSIVVYPASGEITLDKKDDPKGFAFSVKNKDVESADFSYSVGAQDVSRCGSGFTKEVANSYLLGGSGSFSLGAGNALDSGRAVKLDLPETAPPCTIIYVLEVTKNGQPYSSAQVFVTIE